MMLTSSENIVSIKMYHAASTSQELCESTSREKS